MDMNVGTPAVSGMGGPWEEPVSAEKAELPRPARSLGCSDRHQGSVLAPLQDLVEAHHRAAAPRLVADVDVVGELLDEVEAASLLRVGVGVDGAVGADGAPAREPRSRVGHL